MTLPKFFYKILGVILIASFFVPFPGGLLRVALGGSLLICSSLVFALFVQSSRRRFNWFNNTMTWVEDKLGERFTKNLRFTRPENDPRDHFKSTKQV